MNIRINKKVTTPIEAGRIGLFFEDINYGLDGGIHAEMIENRSFEFLESSGTNDNYVQIYNGLYGWSAYPAVEQQTLSICMDHPLNTENPHYLTFTATQESLGFSNKAYDGIFLKKDMTYQVSFFARSEGYDGQIEVLIVKDGKVMTKAVVAEALSSVWTCYRAELSCSEAVCGGTFVIKFSQPGTGCFDFISMMPADAVLGLFRKDLTELLKDMKPGFLRFPGGCVVEGNTIENRYQWKKSVGAQESRKANWNRWAVHGNEQANGFKSIYNNYNQTLGIGYYEYFLLSEYIGARPLPVLNVGLACQYQSTELVLVDDPAFQEYVDDVLDLIEFANGAVDSKWGSFRAQMGHPQPFGLELVGIGNEQWETEQVDFFRRYDIIGEAIHAKWPEIKLIGSAGPDVKTPRYTAAWDYYNDKAKQNPKHVYAVDEHYYVKPEWLYENVNFYDNYPREVKVFAGEYAAHHTNGMNRPELNDWCAALSEAAFLTGIERNADLVVLASYAPLFARLGYAQWSPNMIWFNGEKAYGTPSYYVQKLYSTMTGTDLLQTECDQSELPYTVSYDRNKDTVIIKLVNPHNRTVTVNLKADFELDSEGQVQVMQGQDRDMNTIYEPERVAPKSHVVSAAQLAEYQMGPKSFHVINFHTSKF